MFVVLMPILKRIWPYLVAAVLCFSAGCYTGRKFEIGAADAEKLALAAQQKNDLLAAASADAVAASDLAQADAKANTAEAQLAAKNTQAGAWETALSSQIVAQAAHAGNDAPDAPVLASAFDALAKGNP